MYTKVGAQEYEVGRKETTAIDYEAAKKVFYKKELPFHSFAIIKIKS